MEITTSTAPGEVQVTLLHLKGDLDASTEGQVVQRARELVEQGARRLVVDLSGVGYLSSAGVRALHKVYLLVRPPDEAQTALQGLRDGTYTAANVKLLKPNKAVQAVLATTGLSMYLQVHADLQSALASFATT
jgi:anti-sigma B factor antagonist